jgi:hypothetical protein
MNRRELIVGTAVTAAASALPVAVAVAAAPKPFALDAIVSFWEHVQVTEPEHWSRLEFAWGKFPLTFAGVHPTRPLERVEVTILGLSKHHYMSLLRSFERPHPYHYSIIQINKRPLGQWPLARYLV